MEVKLPPSEEKVSSGNKEKKRPKVDSGKSSSQDAVVGSFLAEGEGGGGEVSQDVSFAISAVGANDFVWSKAVQYGEEIALQVPVGSVQFALRLISLSADPSDEASVSLAEKATTETICGSGNP